jgi:hypothetical protein
MLRWYCAEKLLKITRLRDYELSLAELELSHFLGETAVRDEYNTVNTDLFTEQPTSLTTRYFVQPATAPEHGPSDVKASLVTGV